MTDWRALTEGGILPGSFVAENRYQIWTCPTGVYRIFTQYSNYFKVTPGVKYWIAGDSSMWMSVYHNGAGYSNEYRWSMSGRANIIYWSNEINTHAYSVDIDQYNSYTTDLNCDCNCESTSCFIAGTKVLCYNEDGYCYYKNIEELVPGDKVLGANGTISNVLGLYKATLGDQRSILTFEDQSLYFSDEHPFWVRLDGKEGFGVHNYNAYYLEKIAKNKDGYTIFDHEICETLGKPLEHLVGYQGEQQIIYGNNVEYATTKGFAKHRAKIDRRYDSSTPIYTPILDGSHTMFVNNYLVSTFMLNDWDWKQISCDKTEKALKGLRLSS